MQVYAWARCRRCVRCDYGIRWFNDFWQQRPQRVPFPGIADGAKGGADEGRSPIDWYYVRAHSSWTRTRSHCMWQYHTTPYHGEGAQDPRWLSSWRERLMSFTVMASLTILHCSIKSLQNKSKAINFQSLTPNFSQVFNWSKKRKEKYC